MGVGGDHLAGAADDAEQDLLGGTALMGGNHVAERPQLAHGVEEVVPGWRTGVRLVAAHHRPPLLGAHRPGAAVREQVDEDVGGVQLEDVVADLPDALGARFRGRHRDALDRLDPERLDDRAVHHRWDASHGEPA